MKLNKNERIFLLTVLKGVYDEVLSDFKEFQSETKEAEVLTDAQIEKGKFISSTLLEFTELFYKAAEEYGKGLLITKSLERLRRSMEITKQFKVSFEKLSQELGRESCCSKRRQGGDL